MAAWVAVEVAGSGEAVVGPVEIDHGTPFTLHAVLEARTGDGERVFFTEASRLRFLSDPSGPGSVGAGSAGGGPVGGEAIAPESLRRWEDRQGVRILWFTVEGAVPFRRVSTIEELEAFSWTEFLHLDWPFSWQVPGQLDFANDENLAVAEGDTLAEEFGTQRYHVRIELQEPKAMVPTARYSSWGAAELPQRLAAFPSVIVRLPGALAAPSAYFGLSHLDPPTEPPPPLAARLAQLTEDRLAYAPTPLLARLIREAGGRPDELAWSEVEFDAGLRWGEEVAPGDLLQAGARWVILYRDAGEPGVFDREDLCFDYARGTVIRPLGRIFKGEGGVLQRAPLGGR